MTLTTDEFIRRYLIHVLTSGFHRIRHYGLLANSGRQENLKQVRQLLLEPTNGDDANKDNAVERAESNETPEPVATYLCPDCGNPMVIIERFERGPPPRAPPVRIIAL